VLRLRWKLCLAWGRVVAVLIVVVGRFEVLLL